ncbi:MAG TPA: hypothetical protein VEH31_12735, partial [Streptosporangiaceae bacterium]|nr:hypothetical protein [Streptosporangiaceae bacterium]
ASVIGGAPAAVTVFAREVSARTGNDPRVTGIRARLAADPAGAHAELRHQLADTVRLVHADMLRQVADEFDRIHDVRRALQVGSVDHIIQAAELRPFIIGALERHQPHPVRHPTDDPLPADPGLAVDPGYRDTPDRIRNPKPPR